VSAATFRFVATTSPPPPAGGPGSTASPGSPARRPPSAPSARPPDGLRAPRAAGRAPGRGRGGGPAGARSRQARRREEPRDRLVPRELGGAPLARLAHLPERVLLAPGQAQRDAEGVGPGGDDQPRLAVAHELERPAGVLRREHGAAGEERLE